MIASKAAIADGKGGFFIDTIHVGEPLGDEVLVELKASGICHTDWDSICTWKDTFVLGHEGAGIVKAVGQNVKKVAPGDKVILNWAIPCGHCFQCNHGNVHICESNNPVTSSGLDGHAHGAACQFNNTDLKRSFHLGTMSEYTVVKEAAVVKMTTDISFSSASIVGCGVMTGYGSVVNAANVKAGSSAVVIGCGGVGLNAIQAAKISGASTIIAVDLDPSRIEQAKSFGATHGLIADRNDTSLAAVVEEVKKLTGGRGADYAFECTAVPALGAAPLAMIRDAGVAVQVSGIEQKIDFDCELFEWDKQYINPLYGQCKPDQDFASILKHYECGNLKLDELVTKEYSLDTLDQGFEDLLNGRIAKGVVLLGS